MLIRVRDGTECAIGEEHCGFMRGSRERERERVDQVFVVMQVCEKYIENGKQ